MKMHTLLLILIFLIGHSCGEKDNLCHKTITFTNKSQDTLYVVSSYEYPDTISLIGISNPAFNPNLTKVLPNEHNTKVLSGRDCIENAYNSIMQSDTFMVYVFNASIVEMNPWDTIKSNYMVLKRYDLSLQDLKQMNWTITYP